MPRRISSPEAALPRAGSHEEDRLENRLHTLVCSGQITLRHAQHAIATELGQGVLL
jgi:hypothetical protein